MNFLNQLVNHKARLLFWTIFLVISYPTLAQNNSSIKTNVSDTNKVNLEKTLEDTTKFEMQKSAWGAVLRSAILPGLGQFYNKSYWKIPIVLGSIGYLVYQWDLNNKDYQNFRDLYIDSTNENGSGNISYYNLKEKARDQRDLLAVFIGLAYFLNLVDAYVDAHLFDFDVTEESSTASIRLNLQIKL